MKFCTNCGNKLDSNQQFCPYCGAKLSNENITNSNSVNNMNVSELQNNDKGGFGWGILGFFVPIVGLILFIVWKNEKPASSKAAGIGALISVILGIVCFVAMIIIQVVMVTNINSSIADKPFNDYNEYNYDYD